MKEKYPKPGRVIINDNFWTNYLNNIRQITLPYTFKKMEEKNYLTNFYLVSEQRGGEHINPSFSDGLLFETLRGACDFLSADKDAELEAYIDNLVELIANAQDKTGFISTYTMQNCDDKRFGDNGGDIVTQHDLYNHGCLIEAAISHYQATKKTTFLSLAVKAANLIVDTIGKSPKKNIVPGHSLPEEAFVKLYRLFRDDLALKEFARQNHVNFNDYLDIAEFWYDARGDHNGRFLCTHKLPDYNQDHLPFSQQREAVGHSVRAMLCYLGATVVAQEKNRKDFFEVLDILWHNVVYKKMHITGGIGVRHDIEGFGEDYDLPNNAYLETCAAIGLAFWNTEMNLVSPDSKYFDCFERSLYNNILSAVGEDFKHFFYQNPLESDGTLRRWDWHSCPCCPPMLLKIFSSLSSFIYSYSENSISVNMLIGSSYKNELFTIEQSINKITFDSKGKVFTLKIRIPEYVENFNLSMHGEPISYCIENGYAVIEDVWNENNPLTLKYDTPIHRIYSNPMVSQNQGKVAVTYGPFIMCAEGIDNNGNVDVEISDNPQFTNNGDIIYGKSAQDTDFCLIPYYRWCNRGDNETDSRMCVWLKQKNMRDSLSLNKDIGGRLYGIYE